MARRPTPRAPLTLAAAVRSARIARGWTQASLGRRCGLDPAETNRLERGTRLTLSTAKILFLALAFADTLAEKPPAWEPADYEGWAVLLVELDARARAPGRARAA